MAESINESDQNKIKKLSNIAKELNVSLAQLSIIWCLKNINVSSVILGASKVSQLKENLDSIKYFDLITDEVMKTINDC